MTGLFTFLGRRICNAITWEIVWLGVCRVIRFLLVRWLLLSRIGSCVSRFSVTALCCGGLAVSSCRCLRRVTVVNLAP